MQFVQRYHDNSLVVGSAEFQRICSAAREHGIWVGAGLQRKGRRQPLHGPGADRRPGQHRADAPQAEADARRAHRLRRRRRQPPAGLRDARSATSDRSAAGNTCSRCPSTRCMPRTSRCTSPPGRASRSIAAPPSRSAPELNNAASQVYAAEGQCFVLAPCAVVSPQMVRNPLHRRHEEAAPASPAAASRASTRRTARRSADALPEDQEGIVYADIDLGMISLAKAAADPGRPLCAAGRHPAAARQDTGRSRGDRGRRPRRCRSETAQFRWQTPATWWCRSSRRLRKGRHDGAGRLRRSGPRTYHGFSGRAQAARRVAGRPCRARRPLQPGG